jgi:FK506-binding nuclear protein
MIKTEHEEKEFILCHLGPNQVQYSLSHVLGPEDSPITIRTTNGATVHLTGKWTWELGDDFDGCKVFDESALEETEDADDGESEDDEDSDDDDEEDVETEEDEKPAASKKATVVAQEPTPTSRKRSASTESFGSSNDRNEPPNKKSDKSKSTSSLPAPAAASSTDVSAQKSKNVEKKHEKEKPAKASQAPAPAPVPLPQQSSLPQRKKWKVKPQNDEGISVPEPKPLKRTSGIVVTDFIIGKGAEPKPGAKVKITYEGSFPDGTIFDERSKRSKPFAFRKGTAQVIRGLDLGLEGMRIGGAREIIIPPELG